MKYLILILIFCLSLNSQENKKKSSKRIIFIGDSITAGYGLLKKQAYPSLVIEKLKQKKHDVNYVNAAISGATSASAIKQLQWHLNVKSHILVIALGANDGLRGQSIPNMEKNLSMVIERGVKEKLKILLLGMKMPPNYGSKYTKDFEKVYVKLAKKYKIKFMPFLLKNVATVKKLNLEDGIHPNEEGQKLIAKNVYPYLLELL